MLYFTVGNEVWSRNLANGFEQRQYILPAGETISFIRHRKAAGNPAEFAYNYVIVASKSGNNYKIRMFKKTSGNMDAQPDFIMEGVGEAADALYIAPNISESTYTNTF